ncbi:hypothetical protein [Thermogemmatispora carboxidivorans]|uniref:hypothetical protein n=1 Tax=Thermogemmatispora carboxidivorans TaxID=1382306 RepID=UPI0012DC6CB3|nr:hypothetical protein [Thermogemmatispora carboxidivorans]
MKQLFSLATQDLITFVLPQALFLRHASGEFLLKTDPPLAELGALYADVLSQCLLADQPLLVHIEFQSQADEQMVHRLLMYNILADQRHRCPVYSCVIYLRRCRVPSAPYRRQLPDTSLVHEFHFGVIPLWECSSQDLLDRQRLGVLPLLPLTREGRSRQVIRAMIERLQQARQYELLEVGLLLASLAWADAPASERQWLQEQIQMLSQFLEELKQTDAARALIEEGLQQGIQQDLLEGREDFIAGVRSRFPQLEPLATTVAAHIHSLRTIHQLLLTIGLARSAEELQSLLLSHLPDNAGQPPTGNGS